MRPGPLDGDDEEALPLRQVAETGAFNIRGKFLQGRPLHARSSFRSESFPS